MIFDFKSFKNALTRLFLYISRIVRDFAKKEEDLEARETCLIKFTFREPPNFGGITKSLLFRNGFKDRNARFLFESCNIGLRYALSRNEVIFGGHVNFRDLSTPSYSTLASQ